MSLGSEQYLDGSTIFENNACEVSSDSSTIYTEVSDMDTDPIEDITIDELDLVETSVVAKNTSKPAPNGLMSLLSGNQNAKGKTAKKKSKNVPETVRSDVQVHSNSTVVDSDNTSLSESPDVAEVSFDAFEYEKNAQKRQDLEDLEKKVYSTGRSVSLRDFLKKKDAPSVPSKAINDDNVIVLPSDDIDPEIVSEFVPDMDSGEDICIVEEGPASKSLESFFPAAKTVSARNLFDSFAPKSTRKPNGDWSLMVRLRLPTEKLAAIKQYENPLKTRGNATPGDSMMSTLMRKKPSMKVTLKVPNSALERSEKSMDPLYTKSSGNNGGKSANSVFAMMMKSASHDAYPKLTAMQKLKSLHPPLIERNHMHVVSEKGKYTTSTKPATKKELQIVDLSGDSLGDLEVVQSSFWNNQISENPCLRYKSTVSVSTRDLIKKHAPLAFKSRPLERVYSEFIDTDVYENKFLNWAQKFQPREIESLLITEECRSSLQHWISNAFAVLETQSTKTPRNVKIKELQKKQKKREALADNFIVDDFEEEEEDESTDEDVFVPILIIQGGPGSGKSASVYAAMSAMDGYVHEINTGQIRSRKELHSSLREFCTTQIIHQKHDEGRFQKGLVLFEDSDVLFEQDRTFWVVVQDVLNYSRRPIVVTVQDISAVPRAILDLAEEQKSVIKYQSAPRTEVKQYLWLCAYSEGISLSSGILDDIISDSQTESGTDLRKALMSCQWTCRVGGSKAGIRHIEGESEENEKDEKSEKIGKGDSNSRSNYENNLDFLAQKLDAISVADVVGTHTHSSILHEIQPNELVDVFAIDESLHLRQKTLPHELNIGFSIKDALDPEREGDVNLLFSFNEIHTCVLDFLASRAKKLPKFIQELYGIRVQTRSRSTEDFFEERPETQGLSESSVCYSMPPSAFLVDFMPMARYWAGFQKRIYALDAKKTDSNSRRLQDFLGWRRFYDNVDEVLGTGFSRGS